MKQVSDQNSKYFKSYDKNSDHMSVFEGLVVDYKSCVVDYDSYQKSSLLKNITTSSFLIQIEQMTMRWKAL